MLKSISAGRQISLDDISQGSLDGKSCISWGPASQEVFKCWCLEWEAEDWQDTHIRRKPQYVNSRKATIAMSQQILD